MCFAADRADGDYKRDHRNNKKPNARSVGNFPKAEAHNRAHK